ncbi:hypothetical protein PsorP6_007478 [Peronosclerospora sorghi]|uniref:Uncharacterized protein n=1 Tax=Peronosclerospora sorghi TaxID=230839 RepID=A0ACC0W7C5_9STRA|nr:hypothetical protein PsorP6_007478 [Peronosclerospora sorghi]
MVTGVVLELTFMGNSDDEGVTFQSNALDVVGSWLLSGNADDDEKADKKSVHTQRRPVTLYRPSSASAPSLTRPNAAANANGTLTEQERVMKRKILKNPRKKYSEEAEHAEMEALKQQDEEQDEEEQQLVRLKTQTKNDKKRQRTVQDELLEKLRQEMAKKKAKNQKRRLQLQRKKKQQQREIRMELPRPINVNTK